LRVEEYSRVWEKLRDPINLIKKRMAEIDVEIGKLQARLERLPLLQAEIAQGKEYLVKTQAKLGGALKELDAVQATRSKLEAAREKLLAAERELAQAQSKLQGVQARHQAAQQACADAEAAQKLVTEHRAGYETYLEAQSSQEALDAQVRRRQQVEAQRAEADKRVATLQVQVTNLLAEIERVAEAEKVILELQERVIEQTRLEGELEKARQQQARLEDAQRIVKQQQDEVKRLQARKADLERQMLEAQEVGNKIQAGTAKSEAERSELQKSRELLARLKSQADLVKEQSLKLEDMQSAVCPVCEQPLTVVHRKEMLARNNSHLEAMRGDYRDASKQVQALEASLQQEESVLKKWQTTLLQLPRAGEAQKVGEEVARAESQLEQAVKQVALLSDAAQQVEVTSAALVALGDPRRRYTVASEQAKKRKGLETQLAQAEKEHQTAKTKLEELLAALADFGDLEGQIDRVAATVQTHRNAYQTVLANQRQADLLAARMQEASVLGQELATLLATCADLERAYKGAGASFDGDAYGQAAGREQELQREVGSLRSSLSSLQTNQEKAEREVLELGEVSKALVDEERRKQRLVDEEEVLEMIRSKLRQAGPYISSALNRQISDGARQIFSDLMQDYSRHLSWKEDYSISLEVDGRERTFSQLSGGEQMSAALSVRLALLREMSSIDIAFFDEPTANLDETRREALARQILNVRGFKQLFVISHDDTFEQATQHLVRVERVEGASRVLTA
jgi:exonuclease SbcC